MIFFLATSHPLPATASLCDAWPDAGSITMRGRVGALIALGAGFNPILTGRENIYINGSVLGLTKKEPERRAAWRTEGLGRLKEEQPKVGPKGAASGTMQINGCRRQARRASRFGFRLGERYSSERRSANQIDAKIDEIIDFAEIREFIDMPVMNYSSGMTVRLV